ncbi:MAG: TlpA family protein disulfide reductase [Bdellovibrionales bacterium]|nr:TlpA family protein disulfide reductase [Bdellovibrionales bacterium]
MASFDAEGEPAPSFSVLALDGQRTTLPLATETPQILIFWATWCGPCKIELSRYNDAIAEGTLPAHQILAVSVGEPLDTIKQYLESHPYKFSVFADPEAASARLYPVSATPTVVHVTSDKKIDWIGTGVSPLGLWRARRFLQKVSDYFW